MIIITIIFSGLFLRKVFAPFPADAYQGDVNATSDWHQTYDKEFEKQGVANFALAAAHITHSLTVEDAMTFFNIMMPNKNGIPTANPDLSADESSAVLANVPSRPNGFNSSGMHGFVDFMDHVSDPDWTVRGSKLNRLLHLFHMQETWEVARKAADNISGVSEDICIGALDHANNGIEKGITVIFKAFKNGSKGTVLDKPLTWDDMGESWTEYKADSFFHIKAKEIKSMGLYTHCLMRKFRQPQQPIEMDSCCESKTVGNHTYKLVFAGKVLSGCQNPCIYTRADKPGSQYCFAKGEQKVQCLG